MFLVCLALGLCAGFFLRSLGPVSPGSQDKVVFEISAGTGFRDIARILREQGLIRSGTSFELYALATGAATDLKAGKFELGPGMSVRQVMAILRAGEDREVVVRIPDGASVYQVDEILGEAGVLPKGTFLLFTRTISSEVEGHLFPDTYRFYRESSPGDVLKRMRDNFEAKARAELDKDPVHARENLILASLVEKEVSDHADREIVAGILKKRLKENMILQVDATVCYVKQERAGEYVPCLPISQADLQAKSPFNTYLYKGLPPGPIGSPSLDALEAVQNSKDSPYWFYLNDPRTGKTVFSRTLDEHTRNRVKYLKGTE